LDVALIQKDLGERAEVRELLPADREQFDGAPRIVLHRLAGWGDGNRAAPAEREGEHRATETLGDAHPSAAANAWWCPRSSSSRRRRRGRAGASAPTRRSPPARDRS